MRALHADLTTAQEAAARTPYVRLEFNVSGGDVVFTTVDDPNKIKSVLDWEEPYGGGAVIRISNYDKYFKAKNWKGTSVEIGWGFNCAGDTDRYSETRRVWILTQRDISLEGELVTEFACIDDWYRMAAMHLINAGVKLTGTVISGGDFVLGETITGSVSNATGKLALVGSNFIVVVSVSGTFQTAEDADGASASCDTLTAVTVQSAAGGIVYNEDTTVLNILKAITSGIVDDVVLDEDDPNNVVNTYQPLIEAGLGVRVRWLVRQLLMMSQCGGRIENDNDLHVLYMDTEDATQYTFDSDHAFLIEIRERAVIVPNKVIFVDVLPTSEGDVATYFGTAQDDGSVNTIGEFTTIEVNPSIGSNGEADNLAAAWIAHRVAEANQGRIVAPMECGLELYDMVDAADTRADITLKARIGRIDRRFEPGRYEIELRLGGLLQTPGAGMPGQPEPLNWDITDISITTPHDPITLRKAVYPWQLFQAIQPYVCDITFTSEDKDTISWGSSTIYFADDTTHSIDANAGLDIPNPGWLYFDEDDNVLHYTTTFADCVAPGRGLVAFVAPGTETGATALIWPAAGKVPLLNADVITCMTLSTLTANVGTLTAGIIDGVVIYGGPSREVTLDSDGVTIDGQLLAFTYDGAARAQIYGADAELAIVAASGKNITLYAGSGGVVRVNLNLIPVGSNTIGEDGTRWYAGYINRVYASERMIAPVGTNKFD